MTFGIRPLESGDIEAVVELSLRTWGPVYESLERTLGSGIFLRLHTDWRKDQEKAVRDVCSANDVWVAVRDGKVAGFVATRIFDGERDMGEITILGVDPAYQGRGVGAALTEFATERLREAGMRVAMVETGGDPGHAPARRIYEKAGYTLLPIARYFRNL